MTALEERLARIEQPKQRSEEEKRARMKRIEELVAEFQALPVVDDRAPYEILEYDEHGLPR